MCARLSFQTTELLEATKAALAQERAARMERKWANLRQLELAIASSQPAAHGQPAELGPAGGERDTGDAKAEAEPAPPKIEEPEEKLEGGLTDSSSDSD